MEIKIKIYITSAVFALIFIILVVFFIIPLFGKIKVNAQELAVEKNKAIFAKDQAEELMAFKNNEDYKKNLENINKTFVDPNNPVDFIKFLEKIALESSLKPKISLITSAVDKNKSAPWPSVNFQISIAGDFFDILNFSNKLETGPYPVKIQTLSLKRVEQKINAKRSEIKITGNFLIKVLSK
jgi:Tfp pilus assembly protein PilO